jgi:hypothetical protein
MEIIKVSFDPTEIWNHEDFRQLIKAINENDYSHLGFEYELWIITTNDSLAYINALATQLDIPSERVQMCLNDSTKVGIIILNSDIHFDNDQVIINTLRPNTTLNPVGILVDRKIDYPGMGLKYIKNLDTWTMAIMRERNGDEKKIC